MGQVEGRVLRQAEGRTGNQLSRLLIGIWRGILERQESAAIHLALAPCVTYIHAVPRLEDLFDFLLRGSMQTG